MRIRQIDSKSTHINQNSKCEVPDHQFIGDYELVAQDGGNVYLTSGTKLVDDVPVVEPFEKAEWNFYDFDHNKIKFELWGSGSKIIRNGEECELTNELLDAIEVYMNDDIREALHFKLAPCEPYMFLREYIYKEPEFVNVLKEEFSIEI